ncbi:hypothetical protein [Rhizobium sp. Root1203]|uniref:hypothetical protein n=1 Tax=Rhizobium sp. Root1203 TaxID=1736427 RepID=UPI000B095291|nr:hypothetical protein [Rhizobium sp. Root1203]
MADDQVADVGDKRNGCISVLAEAIGERHLIALAKASSTTERTAAASFSSRTIILAP